MEEKEIVEVDGEVRGDLMPMPNVKQMLARKTAINQLVDSIMIKDVHYGKIPGCGKKDALLKPGAEALCVAFSARPDFNTTFIELEGGHREFHSVVELVFMPTGQVIGKASAICTTMESKYRYRSGPKESTGKDVPKEYWAKKNKGDWRGAQKLIGGQGFVAKKGEDGNYYIWTKADDMANPNISDCYNTANRIVEKRALVAVTLIAFGVSDRFTQESPEDESQRKATQTKGGGDKATTPQVSPYDEKRAKIGKLVLQMNEGNKKAAGEHLEVLLTELKSGIKSAKSIPDDLVLRAFDVVVKASRAWEENTGKTLQDGLWEN